MTAPDRVRDSDRRPEATAAHEVGPPGSDEGAVVRRAQAGDEAAFEDLVRRYSPRLRAILFRITREQEAAQDAAQTAMLRAWQNIDRFEAR